jgi:hypothetical protein
MRHLVVTLSLVLASSLASAGSDSAPVAANAPAKPIASTTVSLVNDKLIVPLAAKDSERSKFSRARLPPSERRVRILDQKPQQDSAGNAFYTFAIDQRHGWGKDDEANWTKASLTGCVYPGSSAVFIKRGNSFHPAIAALGKKTKAAPTSTCSPAAQLSARM